MLQVACINTSSELAIKINVITYYYLRYISLRAHELFMKNKNLLVNFIIDNNNLFC